jgi:CheY-like chemotaxis protein
MSPQPSRLLIVDDNEMNRDMLARRLSRSGYLVDVAENARQLIQRVKENTLDLVLLDIEMPEVSGFDALKMLRKEYSPSQLPIIMVTARNQRPDFLTALRSWLDHSLRWKKPNFGFDFLRKSQDAAITFTTA